MPGLTELWRSFMPRILRGSEREPIDGVGPLERFVSTRSAFVAQKSLYGYLKTRMGVQFPQMFEDDRFGESINIAKVNIFEACLCDLAVHAAAVAADGSGMADEQRRCLAAGCHERGLADNGLGESERFSPAAARVAFATRLASSDWRGRALGSDEFERSPDALVKWAPIVREHKDLDEEFVRNSMRFAWIDVRRTLRRKVDREAVVADAQGRGREGEGGR